MPPTVNRGRRTASRRTASRNRWTDSFGYNDCIHRFGCRNSLKFIDFCYVCVVASHFYVRNTFETLQCYTAAMKTELQQLSSNLDTVFVLFCAVLVFFMNTGFALVESGFCRAKNTVNILAKNVIVFAIATLGFYAIGFGFMFGDGNAFMGMSAFFPEFGQTPVIAPSAPANLPIEVFFLFQLVFAATAATIVSGAVAERIRFGMFITFSALLVCLVYPIVGHWVWGGGFLNDFHDFAGSSVVHSVGGWAALTGVLFLGARHGKYGSKGQVRPIPGHSIPLATAGALILWMGWFGFNPGSALMADGVSISQVALSTNLAAAAGALGATLVAVIRLKSPDLSMTLNGALAGLVAITAGCDVISARWALVVGLCAGAIVVYSVLTFDRFKLDDPVGAISVHLVCGIFGTLAVGIFGYSQEYVGLIHGGGLTPFFNQLKGVIIIAVFVFGVTAVIWYVLKRFIGIRVSLEEEIVGLDISEMKMEAYSDKG